MNRAVVHDYLTLIRLPTVVAGFVTLLVGALVGAGSISLGTVTLALAMAAIIATAQAFNDLVDFQIDEGRVPPRPLHVGNISQESAGRLCIGLSIAALVLLLTLRQPKVLLAAELMSGISLVYSIWLKNTVALGNLVTAGLSGCLLPLGAASAGHLNTPSVLGGVAVFASMFLYEVLKTIRDSADDMRAGLRTVGTALTRQAQLTLILVASFAILGGVVALSTYVPKSWQTLVYWLGTGIGILLPVTMTLLWLTRGLTNSQLLGMSITTMRWGRYFGIIAIAMA